MSDDEQTTTLAVAEPGADGEAASAGEPRDGGGGAAALVAPAPSAASLAIVAQVKLARKAGVPLIAITTPDPGALLIAFRSAYKKTPLVVWDIAQGTRPANEAGKPAAAAIVGDSGFDPTVGNPAALLTAALKLPEKTIVFVHMANRWVAEPVVCQAAWNLRDAFKGNQRTLVMLGPSIDLPPEIAGDVVVFDEPLPGATALANIVSDQLEAAGVPVRAGVMEKAIEALQGLPAFGAEQVVAMSLGKTGLDVPALWERKRRQIELTPGLKVHRDGVKFADIGGVDQVKGFLRRILDGQSKPAAVVFIDEIEKFLAGASGGGHDSSGVSQDQLGTLLAYMQDNGAAGAIFVGPPGAAKSAVAKATGNEGGIPTIQLDLGGMKGSLVGQSEQNLRAALKVITSVSNGRSLWIATCNAIGELPPELRRRFTLGTFFFDLPTREERAAIWKIWSRKLLAHAIGKGASHLHFPGDEGWTGAEIRQCCDIAWRLGCELEEAAGFVVPVSKSASGQLEKLRTAAEGRFLSASKPGVYRKTESEPAATPKRARAHHQDEE